MLDLGCEYTDVHCKILSALPYVFSASNKMCKYMLKNLKKRSGDFKIKRKWAAF